MTIINGAFKEEDLRPLLDKFIERYVLCKGCNYPEMIMRVKGDKILGDCNSCGKKNALDTRHKVASLIIKHPPENKSEFKGTKEEKKTKEANDKKKSKKGKK